MRSTTESVASSATPKSGVGSTASASSAASFIAQIFLRFDPSSLSGIAPSALGLTSSSSFYGSFSSPNALEKAMAPVVADPEFPVILRLQQSTIASDATVQALKSFYDASWKEKSKSILREAEEKFGLVPSKENIVRLLGEQVAADVTTRESMEQAGKAAAGSSVPAAASPSSQKEGAAAQQQQRDDTAIAALLNQEELFFYQDILPSRFLDDYTAFAALSDGSMPKKDVGSASSSQPYADQQHDAADSAEQRLLRTSDVIRTHPRMVFPFSLAVHYRPTKKSRTVNDIIRRSSSVVFDAKGSGPRKSITTLDESLRLVLSTLSMGGQQRTPLQVVSDTLHTQSQPKTMIDDDSAARRGFTVLPFLPPLLNGAMQTREKELAAKAAAAAVEAAAQAARDAAPGIDCLDDIEVTVDGLLQQCGLTEYDAARFGQGPYAAQCRDVVVQKSTMYVTEEIKRKREENVLRLERLKAERDQAAVVSSHTRELSLREIFAHEQEEQRQRAAKTAMEKIRENDANEVERQRRVLQAQRLIKEAKQDALAKLADDSVRQQQLYASIEAKLHEKTVRRMFDTTLDGEQEKAAVEARQRGALSTCLSEFNRPKLKGLDQVARQANILQNAVTSLDDRCGTQLTAQQKALKKSLEDRKWHDTLVAEQQIVRAADADANRNKTQDRSLRVMDRERQVQLLQRDHSEISVMRLVATKSPKDYLDDRTLDNSAELWGTFEKWRDDVRTVHEVSLAKKELHIHK